MQNTTPTIPKPTGQSGPGGEPTPAPTPKPEEPKPDQPKPEDPKPQDPPKPETPKPEQPKPAAKPRGRPRKAKSDSDSDEEEMAAPKRAKRGAGSKPAPTRHEHLLEEAKSDCEECESHGGPFHLKEDKEEFEVVDEAAMMARIKDLTEEAELEEGEVAEGSDSEPSVKDDGEGSEYEPSTKGGDSDFDEE
jgi:hypothetical protein